MSYDPHAVPTSRTIAATSPILIDGGASADLSADRTFSHATSGISAGAVAYPTSITFDNKGHATAATAGSAPGGNNDLSTYRDKGAGTLGAVYWYVANTVNANVLGTGSAITANRIYAVPYISGRGGTLDRITFRVTGSAASSTMRMGIYTNNADDTIYPGNLLADLGTVATTSTGMKAITISRALSASQLYWLVFVNDHGPSISYIPAADCTQLLGVDASSTTTFDTLKNRNTHIRATFTYAALPSTFTDGSITSPALIAGDCPAVAVRYSA